MNELLVIASRNISRPVVFGADTDTVEIWNQPTYSPGSFQLQEYQTDIGRCRFDINLEVSAPARTKLKQVHWWLTTKTMV